MDSVGLTRPQYARIARVPGRVVVRPEHRDRIVGPVVEEGGHYVVVEDERSAVTPERRAI